MWENVSGVLLLVGLAVIATVIMVNVFNKDKNDGTILKVYTGNGKNIRKKNKLPIMIFGFLIIALLISVYVFY